jgi:hypothetical protein
VGQRVPSSSRRGAGGWEEALGPRVATLYRTAFRRPGLLPLIWAGLRRWNLDRRLTEGADPCASSALTRRAIRLTRRRSRDRLAENVDRVLIAVERPAAGLSSAVPVDASEVAAATPRLIEVREILRSTDPIYARGVAMLKRLLRDGGGSLYAPHRRGALNAELELVIGALEGRDPAE